MEIITHGTYNLRFRDDVGRAVGDIICKIKCEPVYSVSGKPVHEIMVDYIWQHYGRNGFSVAVCWSPDNVTIPQRLPDAVRIERNAKRRITISIKKLEKKGIGFWHDEEIENIKKAEMLRAEKILENLKTTKIGE